MKEPVSPSMPPASGPSTSLRCARAFLFSGGFYFLPVAAKPELAMDPRLWLIAVFYVVLDLAQPSIRAVKVRQDSDHFSLQVVLSVALICHVMPVFEWAYWGTPDVQSASRLSAMFVTPGFVVGTILMLLGTSLRIWAIRTLGRFFSVSVELQQEHRLIRRGPYRWVRHPSYTGAVLFLLGVPVILDAPTSLICCTTLLLAAYAYRIPVEERMLSAHFGEEYELYQQATKRLIPYVW